MLMPLRRSAVWPDRLAPWLALALIALSGCLHAIFLMSFCRLDLAPDEAHYWDWSRHLDWSYYSKGPLVAWLIRASCEVVGPWSERVTGSLMFAIRLPAVLCGSLFVLSLYALTSQVTGRRLLALAVVAVALTFPLVAVGTTLMTIDSPYTCCWGWALVFAHRAVYRPRSGWAWEATGLMVGLGILAKYTMVIFLPSFALYLLASREHRRWLLSSGFWSMVGVTALCCLPIVVWNAQHDWVTLKHVLRLAGLAPAGEVALRTGPSLRLMGPLNFLGGQAALLMGYWFLVWLCAVVAYHPFRTGADSGTRFLWWMSVPMFLVFLAFSLKTGGGELNWPVTAYISGGVLGGMWLTDQFASRRPVYRALAIQGFCLAWLCGAALSLFSHRSELVMPVLSRLAGPPTDDRPFPLRRLDPTCRLRGWQVLAGEVDRVRAELSARGDEPVLAATNWSLPGELGVYCAGHPQVYSLGLALGDRHSQYDFWHNPVHHPEEFLGRTFIIVGVLPPQAHSAFERVAPPVVYRHTEQGQPIGDWTIHVCRGFRGFKDVPDAPH